MSLINDALKRAKEAQQQTSPPPSPQMQFQPVEPSQRALHSLGLLVPAALAVVALLALIFVWQWAQARTAAREREVRALTPRVAKATIAPQTAKPSPALALPAVQPAPPPQRSSRPAPATGVATTSTTPASPLLATEQDSKDTNSPAIAPPPPTPPPLRLQAIVFNPKRPSALISGKTVFIGDRLGDSRVVAIDRESATLVGAGKTNFLTMPE